MAASYRSQKDHDKQEKPAAPEGRLLRLAKCGSAQNRKKWIASCETEYCLYLLLAGVLAYVAGGVERAKAGAEGCVVATRENLVSSISSNGKVEPSRRTLCERNWIRLWKGARDGGTAR